MKKITLGIFASLFFFLNAHNTLLVQEQELFVCIDPHVCPFVVHFPQLRETLVRDNALCEKLTIVCDCLEETKTIIHYNIFDEAMQEIINYLTGSQTRVSSQEAEDILHDIATFYQNIETDHRQSQLAENTGLRRHTYKKIDLLKTRKLITKCLKVKRDAVICGDLHIKGQITSNSRTVITSGCQPGPLTIGTSDATDLNLVTQCTDRLTINGNGAVTIHTPEAGETGLTIEGGGEVISAGNLLVATGNIILPQANAGGTQGLLELGGTGATNVVLYEFGTRNFFAGNQTVNAAVTGTDNIAIGTSANSTLTTGNNTIALGTTAQATATDSIAIGDGANTTVARTIVIGSKDSTSTGAAPTANALNAIAIGTASGTAAGAVASGIASVALGSADSLGTFAGAAATGARSIAVGINASAQSSGTVAIGSASGSAIGGAAPVASNISAIAIGSGHLTRAGAIASGISAVAIGGADGTSAVISNFPGAVASGNRSIAIGVNATASAAGTIAVGSASGVGSVAATATAENAIAIGAATGAIAGAAARGLAAVAIGGANGLIVGASASGDRSVAIGNGANTTQDDAIILGNPVTSTAIRVGIGTAGPSAKLHVNGANGIVVMRLDQANTAIGNAPVWLNPSTSAVAGTPIHYNASNQLFGFTSSRRYKTNIRSITTESAILHKLNPVVYDPKEGYGEGSNIPGFIAEEVYAVAPHLVVLNNENQPENVAYNSLHALAVKEIQKQQQQLDEQEALIQSQNTTITMLLEMVQTLEQKITLLTRPL